MSRKSTRSRSTFSTAHSVTSPGRPQRPGAVRLLAVAVTATACALTYAVPAHAADGAEPVVSRGVTIPDFYNPPTELPSANGALIRQEPLPLGLAIPGLDGSTDARHGHPADVWIDRLQRPAGRGDRCLHRAVGGMEARRAAAVGGVGRGHDGPGRPVRALDGASVPADPERRDGVGRLRGPGDLPPSLRRYRGGRHRLRRTRRDRPAAHLRQPGRRGTRPAGRGPRRARRARRVHHPRVAHRAVRIQPGRRGQCRGRRAAALLRTRRRTGHTYPGHRPPI